jgi:electron transfer flavoprotein beta subunit
MLREALARGADRALHVEDDSLASADAFVSAGALAAAMADERFDLVLAGLQSDDQGHGQTGVILAERLGIPHSTIIIEIHVQAIGDSAAGAAAGAVPVPTSVRVKRELEGGWFQWVAMPLPALLTIQSGINQLRYATLKGIMAAKKKEIRKVALPEEMTASQQIIGLALPTRSKQTHMLTGSPADVAGELVRRLRDEARAL